MCCACAGHDPSRLGLGLRSGPTDCLRDEILSALGLENVRAACISISTGLEGLSPYTCRAHVGMLGALAYYTFTTFLSGHIHWRGLGTLQQGSVCLKLVSTQRPGIYFNSWSSSVALLVISCSLGFWAVLYYRQYLVPS